MNVLLVYHFVSNTTQNSLNFFGVHPERVGMQRARMRIDIKIRFIAYLSYSSTVMISIRARSFLLSEKERVTVRVRVSVLSV